MNKRSRETEWLLRALVEGDTIPAESAQVRIAKQLGINIEKEQFFCIAVRYADRTLCRFDVDLVKLLYDACWSHIKTTEDPVFCYIDSQMHLIMVVPDCNDKENYVNKLHHNLSRICRKDIQMGVGRTYLDINKLHYSRVEAYEAISVMLQTDVIAYVDDLYKSQHITTRKLERERHKILEQFKNGELKSIRRSMEQLVEQVRDESPVWEDRPYPTSIRRTVVDLIVEIMHISADVGVDVDAVLSYQDPYRKAFELQNTPEILDWFTDVAQILCGKIAERNTRTESNMLSLAKRCIEKNIYKPELSLALVSEALDITPTYFSSFFIREMGVGFNEYITNIRIEKAQELLKTTNQKISEIALTCGFRSSSYFIVVFRKVTGMSPGEYRNIK